MNSWLSSFEVDFNINVMVAIVGQTDSAKPTNWHCYHSCSAYRALRYGGFIAKSQLHFRHILITIIIIYYYYLRTSTRKVTVSCIIHEDSFLSKFQLE